MCQWTCKNKLFAHSKVVTRNIFKIKSRKFLQKCPIPEKIVISAPDIHIWPGGINCSFMAIYERKYERGMRSLFDYFSKIPKFLIPLKKRFYLTF